MHSKLTIAQGFAMVTPPVLAQLSWVLQAFFPSDRGSQHSKYVGRKTLRRSNSLSHSIFSTAGSFGYAQTKITPNLRRNEIYENRELQPRPRNKAPVVDSIPSIQPWASVIQQTLTHQDVPEHFQKDDTMRHSIEILEEEVLQTTTCTSKDIYMDIQGWTTAFEVELFLSLH